jgi:hypothetical protein
MRWSKRTSRRKPMALRQNCGATPLQRRRPTLMMMCTRHCHTVVEIPSRLNDSWLVWGEHFGTSIRFPPASNSGPSNGRSVETKTKSKQDKIRLYHLSYHAECYREVLRRFVSVDIRMVGQNLSSFFALLF